MKRDVHLYLKDILDCIDKIEAFVSGMDFGDFKRDDKTASAVVRKLEVMGEAAKNVPKSFWNRYPAVSWKEMARMRDKIIHFYFGIDYEIVWNVIQNRLPAVKLAIANLICQEKKKKDES